MRTPLLALVLALFVVACGSTTESSQSTDVADGAPTVEIVSVQLDGATVTLGFDVAATGDLPTVRVDWGDGTSSPETSAAGSLSDTHTYGAEVTEATIVVNVIDDAGQVASAARPITIDAGGVTTTAPGTTTTTVAVSTTTSTTVAPSTTSAPTTTAPPTTTAETTTTTEAPPPTEATTTTEAPPVEVVFDLNPADADFSGNSDGSRQRAERIAPNAIGVFASAGGGGTSRTAQATLEWTLFEAPTPPADQSFNVSVLLEPVVSLQLDTARADGNRASFEMRLVAEQGGIEIASAVSNFYDIGPDEVLGLGGQTERLGFGTSFDPASDLTITLIVSCSASGADSALLPLSISTCDALDGSRGITIPTGRLTVTSE
ncbi:MAG: hypothetical protein ACR2O6_11305 [Ilumatobacteraceae bacterium]